MIIAIAALTITRESVGDVIERRGIEPTLIGEVTGVDDGAVYLRSEHGTRHAVPWDRVRQVLTERTFPGLEAYQARGEALWRARSRIERGDFELAEPILVRLFEVYRGTTSESALVVVEGLLRCRLRRGENAAAVIPALEAARLRNAGVSTQSYAALDPVVDDATLLCTQLAPVWVVSRDLTKLTRDLAEYDARGDEVIEVLARLYRLAAERQLGVAETAEDDETDIGRHDHPGVRLLALIVAAIGPDGDERERARRQLTLELDDAPSWIDAWTHYAIGASQAMESGLGRHQRGMVNLLHVPARFAREQPYLAGIALETAAGIAENDQDMTTANVLRDELRRNFPRHPVLERDASATRRGRPSATPRDHVAYRPTTSLIALPKER
jgi:hypothetical protein